MKHVMIDLETFGLDTRAMIVSIGAVQFDPKTGEIGNLFYKTIDWQSSIDIGRNCDAEVLKWWFTQSDEAQKEILKSGSSFQQVLSDFSTWLPDDCIVWGNGPTFDITKLETAYEDWCGIKSIPWNFRNIRCVRTLRDLTDGVVNRDDVEFIGEKHSALSDAIWQAKYISIMYQALINGIK